MLSLAYRRKLHSLSPLLLAALAACGGGQGCSSCLGPIQGGFPTDTRRHENAMQVRMTGGAIDYLQQNGPALVSSVLGGGTGGNTVNIPASCGSGNQVCCLNGQPQTCTMNVAVQSVQLTPSPPATLSFDVALHLMSTAPIPIHIDQSGITADCYFAINTDNGPNGTASVVDIASDVDFSVDSATDLTNVDLANTKVNGLDQSMLDITPQSGFLNQLACGAANLGFIKSFIISQLQSQLAGQISSAVDGALCAKCTTQSDCDSFADGCMNGQCQRMGKCEQEIGAVGKLDVGSLLGKFSPSTRAYMDMLAVLGGYADVTPTATPGISLGLLGGGQADPHSPCVPMVAPPSPVSVDKWMEYTSEVEPANMLPYHFGIGIHQSHLNTMAFAAFDSGALCLDIGTPQQALLSSATLGVLIPSLDDLVHDVNAPMFLVMRPQQPPTMTLGAGTFMTDMNGKKTIVDPLLHIAMPQFAIDFYAFIDERYVRIMTLTADVNIGVALDVDDQGRIVPLLGDLSKAFTNLVVTNSDLLQESPQKLAAVFPMLLGVAVGQVGGNLKPIALPSLMGLNVKLVAIEPTDNQTFLSIFANLDNGTMDAFHATTEASIAELSLPPTSEFSVGNLDPAQAPRLVLALSGVGIDGSAAGLEYSTRLDDGLWSPYSATSRLEVTDPLLWLQGRHHVEVRARMVGEPATTDPHPVRLDFLVDTIAPTGRAVASGDTVTLSATDNVSPVSALAYRMWDGQTWSAWQADPVFHVGGIDGNKLAFAARDEVGNEGMLEFHGRTTSASSSGCGCKVGAHGGPSGGGWAIFGVLLVGGVLVRRRRSGAILALLVGAGLATSACSDDVLTLGKPDLVDPNDEVGRYSDAIVKSNLFHVSAYDDTTGDLVYAEIHEDKLGDPIQWQWVDGVPTNAPKDAPGSYRDGTTDAGDDIGRYTSIALTGGGDPRIAYFDVTHQQLKYARASESDRKWTTSVVDMPSGGAISIGMYAALSLDAHDVPSIAYVVTNVPNPDGKGGFVSHLRLATAKNASPNAPADWVTVDLDTTSIPCAGAGKNSLCGSAEACVVTDPNDPSKSVCQAVTTDCTSMCASGTACVSGACVAALGPVGAPDLVEGIGLFASIKRLHDGSRVVAYYDREQGDCKLSIETAPGTLTPVLVDGNDPTTDVGQFVATAIAPDDTIHVVYQDAINDVLLYRSVKGTTPSASEVVDDGMRSDQPDPVGAGVSVWADASSVRALWQDQATADLWQGIRGGSGWTKQAVRSGSAGYGFYPHIVADGPRLFLTEFLYDRSTQTGGAPLGHFEIKPLP